MEHIIQFGVTIDDEAIKERVIANVSDRVWDQVYREYFSWGRNAEIVKISVDKFIDEHKEEVIEGAVKKVAESIAKSAACRESYKEMLKRLTDD